MKKILFIGGFLGVGYSFYYYFNQQLKLALDFGYKLKNLNVLELTSKKADIEAEIELTNKSSFEITIKEYKLDFYYGNNLIASTFSNNPVKLKSDSSFNVKAYGTINLDESVKALFPFVRDVISKKPIVITVNGNIRSNFLGINHNLKLEKEQITYSNNLLADIGLEEGLDKIKNKADDLLGKIGIKI